MVHARNLWRSAVAKSWAIWAVVVFVLFNLGPSMEQRDAYSAELAHQQSSETHVTYKLFSFERGARVLGTAAPGERTELEVGVPYVLLRSLAMELSDEGDLRRYAAYASAALHRPYQTYFVRPLEAWRDDVQHSASRDDKAGYQPGAPGVMADRALIPYRDYMVEYPPGFWAWLLPIASLSSDGHTFPLLFSLWMGAVLTAALWFGMRLRPLLGIHSSAASSVVFATALVVALGVVTTMRYDPTVALLVVVAVYASVCGREKLGAFALGAGIATKLVPVVLVIPMIVYVARRAVDSDQNPRVRATSFALWTGLGVLAFVVPVCLYAGPKVLDMFRYHAIRPIEVETIWATGLALFDHSPGAPAFREFSFGSMNIRSPHAEIVLGASKAIWALTLIALCIYFCISIVRCKIELQRRRMLVASTIVLLLVFAMLGAVFSPQYLVWVLPLAATTIPSGKRAMAIVLLLSFALTQLLFPILLQDLADMHLGAHLVSLSRTALLAAYVVLLLRHNFGRVPPHASPAPSS